MKASYSMPRRQFKDFEKEYDFKDVFINKRVNNNNNNCTSPNLNQVDKETSKEDAVYPSIEGVLESIVSQIPRLHDDVDTKYIESPNEADLIYEDKLDTNSSEAPLLDFVIRIPELDEFLESLDDDTFLKELNFPSEFPAYEYRHYNNTLAHNSLKEGTDLENVDLQWESVKYDEGTYINCDLRYFDLSCLGLFDVVLISPPWRTKEQEQNSQVYNTLSNAEIMNLNINCLSKSGFCFLWTTNYHMKFALSCLKKWGYQYVDRIIWIKKTDDNNIFLSDGELFFRSTEICLIGVKKGRGDSLDFVQKVSNDLIFTTIKKNDQKPQQLYAIIEKLCPGARKIELFGRNNNIRPGWLTLGNQLGKQFDHELKTIYCCTCNKIIEIGTKRYKHKTTPNSDMCHKCFTEKECNLKDYFVLLNNTNEMFFHEFYECANCKANPLWGIRFTCKECENFHLCEDCYDNKSIPKEYELTHDNKHVFICIEEPNEKNMEIINFHKCSSCRNYPIDGHVFKCKVCSNMSICQNCFFERKEPIGHNSSTHDMELII